MTVLARSKSGVQRIRRHREGQPKRGAPRGTASTPGLMTEATGGMRRRREAGGMQDEAIYTCECGFVFHAPVSTSVGCPHCGGAQAW
jgi:hypothetical protein